jgi:hypothetical protein
MLQFSCDSLSDISLEGASILNRACLHRRKKKGGIAGSIPSAIPLSMTWVLTTRLFGRLVQSENLKLSCYAFLNFFRP